MRAAYEANKIANIDRHRSLKADREAKRRAAKRGVETTPGITREALRERDGDACAMCGEVMDFTTHTRTTRPPNSASIDHILPLSRGGGHTWQNVALCCLVCNVRKGARLVDEALQSPTPLHEGVSS